MNNKKTCRTKFFFKNISFNTLHTNVGILNDSEICTQK